MDPAAGIHGERDLLVSNGCIEMVAPSLKPFKKWKKGEEPLGVFDLKGYHVLPGLVDIHTHLRVPGQEHKEDLSSGSLAAAAGGFTTILAMPNTRPCLGSVSALRAFQRKAFREAVVRVLPVGAVTRGQKGRQLAPLQSLKEAGAVAFSDDGSPVMDARVAREAMGIVRELGCTIVSHCEDSALARHGSIHEGKVAARLGLQGVPAAAEEVMVARDICLASDTQARVHLAHVSTGKSIRMVRIAKEQGIPVTAEVSPHHLTLTEDAVLSMGANAKVNPPLRTKNDCEELRQGLRDGTVDGVASDHAPHHPDEKALPMGEAPFGVIGLESTLPVLLSLVKEGVISLERAVELLSIGPARVMGLARGSLREGSEADLVVVDRDRSFTLDVQTFRSKARNCPFDGWQLEGVPLLTMVGGQIVYELPEALSLGASIL